MATKRKTSSSAAKRRKTKKRPSAQKTLDRRWSILLFGLGIFFVLLSFLKGEAVWAWMQANILFGVFGISGWLLGPFFIWLAVLVGMEKPASSLPKVIFKGLFIMLAFSGAALVFSKTEVAGLGFGETIKTLFATGKNSRAGGGFFSLVLGWTLLASCGRIAARILMVFIMLIAVMVFTGVTPADIYYFIKEKIENARSRRQEEYDEEYEEYDEDEEEIPLFFEEKPAARQPKAKPRPKKRSRKNVDIDLGPGNIQSQPGLAEHDEVEIGPGGTFGMNPLQEPKPAEEPLMPFDPFSPRSLLDGAEKSQDSILLMSEESNVLAEGFEKPAGRSGLFDYDVDETHYRRQHSPAASLQKEDDFAAKGPDIFAQEEDFFKPPAQQAQSIAAVVPMAGETGAAGPVLDSDVEAMIDKAVPKPDEKDTGADTRTAAPSLQPYRYPPLGLFGAAPAADDSGAKEEMRKTADLLVNTLSSFGVQTKILDVSRGPSVTRYEVQPQSGVKISRITNLADDIALNLAATGVRIEAPIPGKPAVGIEVPNRIKSTVPIRGILESKAFTGSSSPLSIALGKDIAGDCVMADLTKMPHLLVAGSTGSGKSVCINATIMSFLYKSNPDDVKLLLIDPKVVELAEYNGIPHLLMPVVTEPRKAAGALGAAVAEMERRYHLFAENNVRDIRTYNKLAGRTSGLDKMPYIAIVIDELADLMMVAGKDVETYICRIAQKARAAGMHLIVATQRPSVDVITGLIKANIPSRIAFAVSSQVDSRTILDGAGAEKLLGMGDMLFMPVGASKPVRVQGTYVKDEEISRVIEFIKQNSGNASYDEGMIEEMEKRAAPEGSAAEDSGDGSLLGDETFISAVEVALEQGQISTSFLQRRLRLGYARAGRMMDEMERLGIVSGPDGSKPRQLLITRQQWQEMSMNASE